MSDQSRQTSGDQLRSAWSEALLLILSLGAGFFWLQVPVLRAISLQVFALSILIFFVLHMGLRRKLLHLPYGQAPLLGLLTFATVIVTGFSGDETFFPLIYALLILAAFTAHWLTLLTLTAGMLIVIYTLTALLSTLTWQQFVIIPGFAFLALYLRDQYQERLMQANQLVTSQQKLDTVTEQKMSLQQFISSFLKPKLSGLRQLGSSPDTGKHVILSQLDLLESEIDKISKRHSDSDSPDSSSASPAPYEQSQ